MIGVLLDKLNSEKQDYLLTLTNYTCLIQADEYDYHFMKHMQRPIVFSITNELKRHMDTAFDNEVPFIDRDKMRYYSANIMTKPLYRHKAWNIDINAAYPTCLYLNKLIDNKLYWKLMGLLKEERLAAIGMMASRKRRFKIVKGEVVDYIDDESEYAKYFFFCAFTITNIIWQCEIISGTSFVFSWVDGLYVTSKEYAEKCRRLLIDLGYKATVSEVTDFQYTPYDNKITVTFTKDGENKLFNLPIENNRLSQILKFIHYEAV